jgi:hypothetical protein
MGEKPKQTVRMLRREKRCISPLAAGTPAKNSGAIPIGMEGEWRGAPCICTFASRETMAESTIAHQGSR